MGEIKTKKVDQIFFDDIKAGDQIPELIKEYSLQKMAVFAMVHGDWCPGHYDYKWAREKFNQPAPFAYGLQITAHCSQAITDWMGPNGALKKFRSRTVASTYPHDIIAINGKVKRKYVENGQNYVECEVWAQKQDGVMVAEASAIVNLPGRNTP
jgi:acyl dehydratase